MSSTQFITRGEAGIPPAVGLSRNTAFRFLTAHYSGPSPWNGANPDHNRCATIWRSYYYYHVRTRGWSDIAYTSGVCPHGVRFEGRPLGARTAANGTNIGNYQSAATCYIAGVGDPLTAEAAVAFLDEQERMNLPLAKVHSDWKATGCPGDPLREWVKDGAPHPHASTITQPNIDWAALRRLAAHTYRGPLGDQPVIGPWSHSLRVALVQQVLNLITGAKLDVDGKWGPKTQGAIQNFQRFFGRYPIDGIFGDDERFIACIALDKIKAGEI